MLHKVKSWLTFTRIGGIGAIGFATMIVLGNAIALPAGQPAPGADMADVTAYFSTNGGIVGTTAALIPAGWLLITIFGAAVVAITWRGERDRGEAWALVGFAGVLLQNGAFVVVIASRIALVADPESVATFALHDAIIALNGTFLATALIGLSMCGRRSGIIPNWLAALGFLAATLQFAGATLSYPVTQNGGSLGPIGLTGWLIWVVWLVAYGIRLIRRTP
ncbi:hypothetical protein FB566_2537 [Stackebrandtia endophytica]|uniref:DUF4386 family protein n=1 Tax=Stackebrandtia endophytica TaxID=1496996 RepID=A0A543AWN6_9ACTN|nr:hypothetical protein [Stackebrandtia endophytica]TQL76993.1 hypothetical protein FB566_2537 [Stackebrandtia endophytica]